MEKDSGKQGRLPPSVPYEEGLLERLADPEYAALYLDACMQEGGQDDFMRALHQVARAQPGGVAGVARLAKVGRPALSRALTEGGDLGLARLTAVLAAAGVGVSFRPLKKKRTRAVKRAA